MVELTSNATGERRKLTGSFIRAKRTNLNIFSVKSCRHNSLRDRIATAGIWLTNNRSTPSRVIISTRVLCTQSLRNLPFERSSFFLDGTVQRCCFLYSLEVLYSELRGLSFYLLYSSTTKTTSYDVEYISGCTVLLVPRTSKYEVLRANY